MSLRNQLSASGLVRCHWRVASARITLVFVFSLVASLFSLGLPNSILLADEAARERLARLNTLSVAEKEELAKKKETFDKLSEAERKRVTQLLASIESQPNSAELLGAMERYYEWLKTLSANQQAELRDLPDDKRIARIKQMQRDEQRRAWERLTTDASAEDLEAIYSWLQEFVAAHREKTLESLPEEIRRRISKMDTQRQSQILMFNVLSRRNPLGPQPSPEEIDTLIARLSPAAQELFRKSKDPGDVMNVLSSWGRSAIFSKAFPVLTKEELAGFFQKLPAEERDRLEKLTAEDRDSELKQIYARTMFFGLRPGERLFDAFSSPRRSRDRK